MVSEGRIINELIKSRMRKIGELKGERINFIKLSQRMKYSKNHLHSMLGRDTPLSLSLVYRCARALECNAGDLIPSEDDIERYREMVNKTTAA